jgi:hypothetical protein
MASDVTIVNAALQLVKHSKTISNLEGSGKEATAANTVYEELRQQLLEMHNWNFATTRVKLARLATTPAYEWDYEYNVPARFIRVVSAHNNTHGRDQIPYKLEGGKLLTDASDLYLRYIEDITDPNQMPPSFRLAFSKLIASRLAVALANSVSLSKEMYDQFIVEDLPTAKSIDSIQDKPDHLPESSWVAVRSGQQRDYEPGEIA